MGRRGHLPAAGLPASGAGYRRPPARARARARRGTARTAALSLCGPNAPVMCGSDAPLRATNVRVQYEAAFTP
jgi:hypothetical protein